MENKKGSKLISLGLLLIAAALFLAAYNRYDAYKAEQSAQQAVDQLDELIPVKEENIDPIENVGEVEVPDYILNPEMEMPAISLNDRDYIGVLEIPACSLELPVMKQWSYTNLKIAPCRYEGSVYTNDLVIAAHNYKSYFGKLNHLIEGDPVVFTDMDGNVFTYQVAERETLAPTAIEEMTGGEWDLTLFTCTVGGRYRTTIRCDLVTEPIY